MEININERFLITFPPPVDEDGNPAQVEPGSVRFRISDPTKAHADQEPSNQYAAQVFGVGVAPELDVIISADADLGAGVRTIERAYRFAVVAGPATGFPAPTVGPAVQQ